MVVTKYSSCVHALPSMWFLQVSLDHGSSMNSWKSLNTCVYVHLHPNWEPWKSKLITIDNLNVYAFHINSIQLHSKSSNVHSNSFMSIQMQWYVLLNPMCCKYIPKQSIYICNDVPVKSHLIHLIPNFELCFVKQVQCKP
jgi:hypothetical protein